MADYNTVMAQLQQQAQQAAQDRMAALLATGQYIPLEGGSLWNVAREQAVTKDQLLGDALVPAMQAYVAANPNDPAAQQMQSDLTQMQAAAHKGDFGSFLHGAAVSGALGGALSGFGMPGMSLGESLAAQGLQGGPMLGEGVMGPPQPGGSFFTGPPSPGVDGFVPGPAGPTPILGEGLMGPPAPGGDFFTGPPAPAGTPAATGGVPAQLPPVQNIPGQNKPLLPTTPGTTNTIIPGDGTAAATAAGAGQVTKWLNDTFGLSLTDADLSTIGKLGSLGLGLLGSNAQTEALKGVLDQQRAERAPALNAFNNMLANPNDWYNSAPAMGATEGVLRKLSVNGNPAGNPADLSKAAAYNLGGYNDMLRTMGNLGLSGQDTSAKLGTQLAGAQGNAYNLIGAGISELTQPKADPIGDFQRLLRGFGVSGYSAP